MPNQNRTENLDAVIFPEIANAPSELKTPQSRNVTLEEWNRTQLRTGILEDFIRALKTAFVPAVKADIANLGTEFENLDSDFTELSNSVANDLVVSFSGNTLTLSIKHGDTVLATGNETLPFSGMLNGTPTYADGTITFPTRAANGTTSSVSVDISGLISGLASTVSALQSTKYEKPSGGIPKTDLEAGVQNTLDAVPEKYVKPQYGIPAGDLTEAIQTTLTNADDDHAIIPNLAYTSESGYSLEFSMDPTTYILTATLKNKAGTPLSTGTVDLPLESLLLGASVSGNNLILTFRIADGDPQTVTTDLSGLISAAIANKANTSDLTAHTNNDVVHITAAERSTWNAKQNAETGKGLSTEDFTTAEKTKLTGIETGANKTVVDSSLSESSENPVQNKVVKEALDGKVDKETGKSLSTNDYTTTEKEKLYGIETGANKTIVDSALSESSENPVQNKVVKGALDSKYEKPSGGIPSTDLSSTVQTTLSNADTDHATIPTLALTSESGYSISFSVNTSTYVLTAQLLNKAGTVLSTQTVDLPLESVVVSGSYDDTTKKVTLTLVSGSTVEFSIADLISGLVSTETFTAHTGNTTVHITAAERATWNNKADKDGVYNEMTVGTAEQLLASVYVEDKVPYNFRTSGGSTDISNRETATIVGGTIVWNQFCGETTYVTRSIHSYSNGKVTFNGTTSSNNYRVFELPTKKDHVYLIATSTRNPNVGLTCALGGSAENLNTYLSSGKYWFVAKSEGGAVSNIGLCAAIGYSYSDEDVYFVYHDLTDMFGETIAEYILSLETTTTGAGLAWFRKLFPKDYYAYNTGSLQSVNVSSHNMVEFNLYNHVTGKAKLIGGKQCQITGTYTALSYVDINGNSETLTVSNGLFTPTNDGVLTVTGGNATDTCVHFVWSGSRNGEYEPYEEYSYPLDSSLALRGIPLLDANDNLYYDGDVYEGGGLVTRKYGIVDLGTLTWEYYSQYDCFHTEDLVSTIKFATINLICPKYLTHFASALSLNNLEISTKNTFESGNIIIKDTSYTDETTFTESLQGVYLVYELAAPTTEQADSFANPQIISDWGTEEYVDYGVEQGTRDVAIPVGHITQYLANLRDKLQHLPSLGNSGDGVYHIQQIGTQMYLVLDTTANRLTTAEGKITTLESKEPVFETYTLATSDWSAISSSEPYTYSATVTATHTIGNDTVIELLNNNPVLFAKYGFAVSSVSGQTLTIYSIGQPDASVSLEVQFNG